MNPFRGVKPLNPWHWPYLIGVILTPIVVVACITTLFVGGWFIGLLWFVILSEITPEEVENARLSDERLKGYHANR